MKLRKHITEEKASKLYNTNGIDYKKAFDDVRLLADLEWNGSITIVQFRDNVNEIILVISRKEDEEYNEYSMTHTAYRDDKKENE